MHLTIEGHSGAAGGGDVDLGFQDVAARIRRTLLGMGSASGTGVVLVDQNVGGDRDDRFAFVGTWTSSGNDSDPYVYVLTANQEITFSSDAPGTIAEVLVGDNANALQIYVDDVLKETYTGPNVGGAAVNNVWRQTTGLSYTKHKIRIKTGGVAAVVAFRVRSATGIEVSNLGRGGAEVADWIDPDSNSNNGIRDAYYQSTVTISYVGANEALQGTPVATMKADYQTYLAAKQSLGIPVILMTEATPPTSGAGGTFVTTPVWEQYLDAYYDLADEFDIPLVDQSHAMGPATNASALDMLSVDGLHLNRKGYAFQAEVLMASLLEYVNIIPDKDRQSKPWVQLTQAQYDALVTKDSATMYVIVG